MTVGRGFDSYHRQCKGKSLDWNRSEVFVEDNPIIILVLEPRHIDSLLDDRMPIREMRSPAKIGFLYASVAQ